MGSISRSVEDCGRFHSKGLQLPPEETTHSEATVALGRIDVNVPTEDLRAGVADRVADHQNRLPRLVQADLETGGMSQPSKGTYDVSSI